MKKSIQCLFFYCLLFLISACQSGGNQASTNEKSLTEIAIYAPLSIAKSTKIQASAIGIYSDGSTQDITNQVIWKSSDEKVILASNGIIQGELAGNATLQASMHGVTSNLLHIHVSNALLVSLTANVGINTLINGTTTQVDVIGTFNDNSTQNLTDQVQWSTTDLSVVSFVNSTVTAKTVGSGAYYATIDRITSNSIPITVVDATLQSINITVQNSSIANGTSTQLAAYGVYSDGSSQNLTNQVTWKSDTTNIVNINSSGYVTGNLSGDTKVNAEFNGIRSNQLSIHVSTATLRSIDITVKDLLIAKGTSTQLTAIGTYSDNSTQNITSQVSWLSTDQNTANVSQNGIIYGNAIGRSYITAKFAGISSNQLPLTISSAVLNSVSISAKDISLTKGMTTQLTAIGTYSDNSTQVITNQVTWKSSDPNILNIDTNSIAFGNNIGASSISANFNGKSSDKLTVNVTPAILESINVFAVESRTLAKGTSIHIVAIATYSDGNEQDVTSQVNWSSSNQSIANVSSGLVTGVSVGGASISSTYLGKTSNSLTVTVTPATLVRIVISAQSESVSLGSYLQFIATGNYSDDSTQDLTTKVSWISSSPSTANITDNGLANGLSLGSSNIMASYSGKVSQVFNVTVVNVSMRAYITNWTTSGSYTQCNVSGGVINPDSCITSTPSGNGAMILSEGLAFNNNFAYFSNNSGYSYTQCLVNPNGIDHTNCQTINLGRLVINSPSASAVNNGIVFFADNVAKGYTQCNTNANGIISSSCKLITPSGFSGPTGIAFYNGYAYFSNWGSSYTQCSTNIDGTINNSSCNTFTPASGLGSAYNLTVSNNKVYFTSKSNYITQCNVTGNGIDQNSCTKIIPQGSSVLVSSAGIGVHGNYIYITDSSKNQYVQCMIDSTGILVGTCTAIKPSGGGSLSSPVSITFN